MQQLAILQFNEQLHVGHVYMSWSQNVNKLSFVFYLFIFALLND